MTHFMTVFHWIILFGCAPLHVITRLLSFCFIIMSLLNIVEISSESLPSLDFVSELVQDDGAGAITTFSGTTRNVFEGSICL